MLKILMSGAILLKGVLIIQQKAKTRIKEIKTETKPTIAP